MAFAPDSHRCRNHPFRFAPLGSAGPQSGVGTRGQGAVIGAATVATAGLLSGIFDAWGSCEVDPVYSNFVDRCLRERGYEPIGWK
jgi:hypothetical protein